MCLHTFMCMCIWIAPSRIEWLNFTKYLYFVGGCSRIQCTLGCNNESRLVSYITRKFAQIVIHWTTCWVWIIDVLFWEHKLNLILSIETSQMINYKCYPESKKIVQFLSSYMYLESFSISPQLKFDSIIHHNETISL